MKKRVIIGLLCLIAIFIIIGCIAIAHKYAGELYVFGAIICFMLTVTISISKKNYIVNCIVITLLTIGIMISVVTGCLNNVYFYIVLLIGMLILIARGNKKLKN